MGTPLVLFLISAQTQEGVSERTEKALTQRGDLLTGSTPGLKKHTLHSHIERGTTKQIHLVPL